MKLKLDKSNDTNEKSSNTRGFIDTREKVSFFFESQANKHLWTHTLAL